MFKCRIIDIVLTSAVLFVSAPPEDSRCRLCPEGWLWWRRHCYFFSVGLQEDRRWNESAEFCQEHNSSLVVIKDDAEMVTDRRETKTKMAAFTLQSEVTRFRCFVKSDFFFFAAVVHTSKYCICDLYEFPSVNCKRPESVPHAQ
uniref:C-type lectin domain-containing protein n=1 Tax=Xiphophorus couchianus TaxID=32473 RepID=A0A3B5KQ58_9TELE